MKWLLAAQIIAFWPVWTWYAGRIEDLSELAGITIALAIAVCAPQRSFGRRRPLWIPALATLAYAAAFPLSPPLVRALFALAAVASTWTCLFPGPDSLARGGLFLLAAPVLPSLRFYLGYPLRFAVTEIAAAWLRLGGLSVQAEGTALAWNGRSILVDAPCSGIGMLWGAVCIALAMAVFRRLDALRTLALLASVVPICLLTNSMRAAALFYKEAELLQLPNWTHGAAGSVMFAITLAVIVWSSQQVRRPPCVV
jgi:exosortase/archaeosortase family protein